MRMHTRTRVVLAVTGTTWLMATLVGSGQLQLTPSAMRNHPAITYTKTPPADAVAKLNEGLKSGEVRLEFEPVTGYLHSVLRALDVSTDSQVLVFSKTSFQAPRITPQNPRALFFNDTVSVGFVRGGEVLEFVALDPRQGAMFYTLDNSPTKPPQFTRDMSCVQCHTWDGTANVPGWFLGSVWPAEDGRALDATGYGTDHRTGFEVRWGGWYVTGKHSFPSHMGNAVVPAGGDLAALITPESVHVESLEGRFDMTGYPSRYSDIVALMVLEHQARMSSLITRVGWEARLGAEAGRPLRLAVEELVDYLLFVDEAPLPGKVEGMSTFARTFASKGPRDSQGRSLRELDLESRLMRYPCSYMIYSEPFDALPAAAKDEVYARMWEVLSGSEQDPKYARLSDGDRRNIVDILRETKRDLPFDFGALPAISY
jgi:hypothetical protein